MNARGWVFYSAVVAAALMCVVAFAHGIALVRPIDIVGAASFAAIAVLSEAMALDFTIGASAAVGSSVAYLPLLACAVSFPPLLTVFAGGGAALIADLMIRRMRPWLAMFNASQYMIALSAGTLVYAKLGGGQVASGHVAIFAFFGLAVTYFAANTALVGSFVSIRRRVTAIDVFRQMAGPTGGNLLYDILASPLGLFAAWLNYRLGLGGIFVAMLPILLVRYSYLYAIQLKRANSDLVRVLIKAIETRDRYTSGHSIRVSTLAKMIAQDLGLSSRKVTMLEQAALLHDIGKIEALYASIINKPHELTAGERALIKTHATKGADMLLQLSAFKDDDVIKGVRHHHERFDGTGYPDGLKAGDIPLFARIIMICDALDAMLSDRPYRPALDVESVKREMVRCSGEQFDPQIVGVILERGTIERAGDLVRQEPPDAMTDAAVIAAVGGG